MRPLIPLALLCSLVACADPETPQLLDEEGDPCRSSQTFCIDDETARECIGGIWAIRSCDEICAEAGPKMLSEGCGTMEIADCVCVPAPGACVPGSTLCASDTELSYCDASQEWTLYDCSDLCAASLATPISEGCDLGEGGQAACWCLANEG